MNSLSVPAPMFIRLEFRKSLKRTFQLFLIAALALLLCKVAAAQAVFKFTGTTAVNASTTPQSVTVKITRDGVVGSLQVLSSGAQNLDFAAAGNGGCAVGQSFLAGQTCSVPVVFQPKSPGGRHGAVVVLDGSNNVLGIQTVFGTGSGPLSVVVPGMVNTVAGDSLWLYSGDGNAANQSSVYLPGGVVVDALGNVFLSDTGNNRVRRVDGKTGIITTVAGTGLPGTGGDGGPATSAAVNSPGALALDGMGNLYIADSANHAIRRLDIITGTLTTVVGTLGQAGRSGDNGPAASALLNTPQGLTFDSNGNLFVADTGNHVIRRVDAVSGIITTIAGTGVGGFSGDGGPAASAALNTPWGLAVDSHDDLYIADLKNNRIREITTDGKINTIVGTGLMDHSEPGLPGTQTNVRNPAAVAVDLAGNVFYTDSGNNVIRKLSAKTNLVSTTIGYSDQFGSLGIAGDGDSALAASIYGPYALAFDTLGNLYFSDMFHNRIRALYNNIAILHFPAIRVGRTSDPQNVTIENDGNADLTWTSFQPDLNSTYDPAKSTCNTSTAVSSNESCMIAAEFMPQVIGDDVKASINLNSNAVNSPDVIKLDGEVDELEPTQTTLSSTPNPSAYGANVTFTASVASKGDAPSGTVRFLEGSTVLDSAVTNAASTATFTTSALPIGTHTITAAFMGDASNSPSTSAAVIQVVKQTATVALTSSLNPARTTESVTFTATVSASQMTPTGTVAFMDGTTTIGTANVNGSGVATMNTNLLTAGAHKITAVYSGDTNTMTATSQVLTQTINPWTTVTTLSSSAASVNLGENVTFSVSVTPTSSSMPSGTVALKDGSNTIATITLDTHGNGTYTTNALAVGTHILTATYSGDSNNDVSTSSQLTQTVTKIATTTSLASSQNPSHGGATIQLTATVTPSTTNATAGSVTGTVTFKEGANVLGTVNLTAAGTATLSISSLPVATHSIVASYSGNNGYDVSTSAALQQQVTLATSTTQVTSSLNPSIVGNAVTLTAVVSSNGGVPTGDVTFLDGGNSIGTGTLKGGQATLSTSTLAAGAHNITVRYDGDANDNPSTSAVLVQTVNQATTAIALTSSSNPAIAGTTITFIASLTSNGSIPTGQITLQEGATVLGTATLSPTGAGQFSINNLSAGTHQITAHFAGDAGHAASTSAVVSQQVNLGTSAAAITSSKNPSIYNDAVTFTAKITGTGNQPTGAVVFADGATTLATVPMNAAGVATYTVSTLAIGNHTIAVQYAGDTTHSQAPAASIVQRVLQATTTTLISSVNPSIAGQTVRFTATVVGASQQPVTGSITFSDGGVTLGTVPLNASGVATLDTSNLTVGGHPIVATYSGDAGNSTSASQPLQQSVNSASTTVSLVSSANPAVVGSPVTFTATVVSEGAAANGNVAFLDGSTIIGTSPVVNGVAAFSTTALAAGQHAITARYNGGSSTQTSVSTILLQVEQAVTHISLTSSLNPSFAADSVTLTAQLTGGANATGAVTFLDGQSAIGSTALSAAGTATFTLSTLSAGSHSFTAVYAGDTFNLSSTSPVVVQVVNKRATTTTATASANSYKIGDQITLFGVVKFDGSVAPGGSVTFSANGTTIGTSPVSATGVASFSFTPSVSTYDIVATYSGDDVYQGSASSAYTIAEGENTSFTMTMDPPEVSINSGEHTTINLTFASMHNFTDTLALGCLELPYAATCTFSQTKITLPAGGSVKVQLVFDTGNPLGSGARASVQKDSHGVMEAGVMVPAGVLMGLLLFFTRRKRALQPLLFVVALVLVGLGMTGCGNSMKTNSTPAGTYTVRVMASGTGTGANRVGDLNVVVK